MDFTYYKLEIFAPESCRELVLDALHGAENISYAGTKSVFESADTDETEQGQEETSAIVSEIKIEATVKAEKLEHVMRKLVAAHPYDKPVINVLPVSATAKEYTSKREISYGQMKFDENMNIVTEPVIREMTREEKQRYDSLVDGAEQLNLFDFL